jgi:hypothetical protein
VAFLEVAPVDNAIDVGAPAEEIFDFVVDVRNEPRWSPQLLRAQMLTPQPLLVAGVRLSVTALSYDGQLAVSLLADDNMPDLPVLAAGVRPAFEDYIDYGGRSPED